MSSCSFNYYDEDSGITHQFGFGYSRFKTLKAGDKIAVIRGVKNIGLATGTGESSYFGLGFFDSTSVTIFSEDYGFKVEKESGDLFKSKFYSFNKGKEIQK